MAERIDAIPAAALAVYAHPDDAEVSCGGALARWSAAGCRVHVVLCTTGDKGSSDPAVDPIQLAERRSREAAAAGRVLGVSKHHQLGYADGEIDDTPELRKRIVALVRELKPSVVVAPDPTAVLFGQHYVNHRDHRAVGWATLDAVCHAAGNPHYFPDAGAAHRPDALYLSGTLEADVWVDITDTIDVKAEAIARHQTQVGEPGEWLRTVVRQRAEDAGREAGVPYAEAFRRVVLG